MIEQAKLLAMTAILTALVWAGADSLVNEAVTVDVTFEVVPSGGAPGLIVQALAPDQVYELHISGPRRVVQEMQSQSPLKVRLPIADHPTGPATVPIDAEFLKTVMAGQWKQFQKLTIGDVQPPTINVMADHWITAEVQVECKRVALAYDVKPQIRPTSVSVRMRESAIVAMPDRDRLQLEVGADVEHLLKERPVGTSVTVPLTLDSGRFGAGAVLTPNQIAVTATVKSQRATQEIPTVPILFAVSAANLDRPLRPVSRDGTPLTVVTRTITATGSTDAINRLASGSARAYGIIQLKQDDLEDVGVLKVMAPDYHLPPGIQLAKEPEPVEFKLIDTTLTEKKD